jgi:hypothetical protein
LELSCHKNFRTRRVTLLLLVDLRPSRLPGSEPPRPFKRSSRENYEVSAGHSTMPKPKPPPTPAGSTDIQGLEQSKGIEMESMFTLPPPAMRSNEAHVQSNASKPTHSRANSTVATGNTPPISPQDRPLHTSPRQKRTSSGVVKPSPEIAAGAHNPYALPPPPSRARKIIQMKPKAQSTNNSSPASDASYVPPGQSMAHPQPAPAQRQAMPTMSTTPSPTGKAPATTATASTAAKRKQPSATSAAGRKIARKTAHSIIERRRRSKMNEEFGVLKDMIPACEGVEMHKLAILQAGIEYVRYLEGCVAQLKAENANLGGQPSGQSSQTGARGRWRRTDYDDVEDDLDEEDQDEDMEDNEDEEPEDIPESAAPPAKMRNNSRHNRMATNEWTLRDSRKSSVASLSGSSTYPSPYLHSQHQSSIDDRRRPILPSTTQSYTSASPLITTQTSGPPGMSSATPTPTLLSPAINSFHFSPDLSRSQTNSSSRTLPSLPSTSTSWTTVNNPPSGSIHPSPGMQPLPSPKMTLPAPHSSISGLQLPPHYNSSVTRERDPGSKSPGGVSDISVTAEATASAALMMLTNDWRGAGRDGGASVGTVAVQGSPRVEGQEKGKGMSVRDLLSS